MTGHAKTSAGDPSPAAFIEEGWPEVSEHNLVGIRGHLNGYVTSLASSYISHLKNLGFMQPLTLACEPNRMAGSLCSSLFLPSTFPHSFTWAEGRWLPSHHWSRDTTGHVGTLPAWEPGHVGSGFWLFSTLDMRHPGLAPHLPNGSQPFPYSDNFNFK